MKELRKLTQILCGIGALIIITIFIIKSPYLMLILVGLLTLCLFLDNPQ